MVNSRQKGKLGEKKVKEFLESKTPYTWEYTPGSGSGRIKGDLYFPKCKFVIEIKNYAESPLTDKVLTNSSSDLRKWWVKLLAESKASAKIPLLFFRYNRSKLFVCTSIVPENVKNYIAINDLQCYIMLADEWIEREKIEWVINGTKN